MKLESVLPVIYDDSITHSIAARDSLPKCYLLEKSGELIECAGLIANDFISRGDLFPWICAIFIEEKHRGNAYGSLLIEKAKADARTAGCIIFKKIFTHLSRRERIFSITTGIFVLFVVSLIANNI